MQSLANKLCFYAKCSWARVVVSFVQPRVSQSVATSLLLNSWAFRGSHLSYTIVIQSPEHSTTFTVFFCPCPNLLKHATEHIFTKIRLPENKMYPTISHNMKTTVKLLSLTLIIILETLGSGHTGGWQCALPHQKTCSGTAWRTWKITRGIQLAFPRFLFDWACMWCSGTSPIHGNIAILSAAKWGLHVLDLFQDVPWTLSQVELLGNWRPVRHLEQRFILRPSESALPGWECSVTLFGCVSSGIDVNAGTRRSVFSISTRQWCRCWSL